MLDQLFVNGVRTILNLAGKILPEWLLPWLQLLLLIGAIAAAAPAIMMYLTLIERKVIARMQNRFGPNRVGIYGLLQPLSDGVKMLLKEDIVPQGADRLVHLLAPTLAVVPAILLFAVVPFGRNMIAVDLNVGLLYFLAISSISSYAIFMGGWASRSKFSTLGAMRAVAQIISYEVPGVLSVVTVIMVAGTLSMAGIVEAQGRQWFVCTPWGLAGCLIVFMAGVAEVNRTPFDMPEAESEIVAGFHTEYSGMKFALWYMAEFLEAFAVCALTVTLFLGGWQGPAWPMWPLCLVTALLIGTARFLPQPFRVGGVLASGGAAVLFAHDAVPSWIWFLTKTYSLVFVLVWLRGTFPRLRVDQLMGFAWKFLLPMSLMNILAAGAWVLWPGARGTVASAAILIASFWILVRANAPAPLKARSYVLVD